MTNTTDRELCERLITKLQDIAHGRCRNLDIIQETCRKGAAILEHPSSRERQLEEALRFYADHENWWGVYIAGSKSAMVEDWGHPTDDFPDGKPGIRARQALSQSPITEPVDEAHPFEALSKLINGDPEYAWAWHCNLAVPIMDAARVSHEKANGAAALIMAQMFDVDITQHEHYRGRKSATQEYFEMRVEEERLEDAALRSPTGDDG